MLNWLEKEKKEREEKEVGCRRIMLGIIWCILKGQNYGGSKKWEWCVEYDCMKVGTFHSWLRFFFSFFLFCQYMGTGNHGWEWDWDWDKAYLCTNFIYFFSLLISWNLFLPSSQPISKFVVWGDKQHANTNKNNFNHSYFKFYLNIKFNSRIYIEL